MQARELAEALDDCRDDAQDDCQTELHLHDKHLQAFEQDQVCVRGFICIYIYVYICIYIYVCIYVCMCVCIYLSIYLWSIDIQIGIYPDVAAAAGCSARAAL